MGMFRRSHLWERDDDCLIIASIGGFGCGFPNPVLPTRFKGRLSFTSVENQRCNIRTHGYFPSFSLLFISCERRQEADLPMLVDALQVSSDQSWRSLHRSHW